MTGVAKLMKNVTWGTSLNLLLSARSVCFTICRNRNDRPTFVEKPKIGVGKAFRRIIHYPEKYTIEPLNVTNLAGRDPVTGRVAVKGIGGGIKHKYHWIKWTREGPKDDSPPALEKVIKIMKCGCRTSDIALVAVGDKLKYIMATENMNPGDIIKTSMFIPRIPVRANEGDAYPLGALPVGTLVHNVQINIDTEYTLIHGAGTCGVIRKHMLGQVVVQLPSKEEMAFNPQCMATVGRLSNVDHGDTHIGSAQRNRELGNRPRSGLWQRKTGKHGRKIRPLPPVNFMKGKIPEPEILRLTHIKWHI